ncbi:MAG: hypothetical protein E7316_00240 [Clostridiales bacterium]|nr:hypothetical protein [Clostridiales bacterium]
MMKKWLSAFILSLLVLLAAATAMAAEAMDITAECSLKASYNQRSQKLIQDKKYTTYWESGKSKTPWLSVTAPAGMPIHGLYICFGTMPETWEIQVHDGNDWMPYQQGDTRFLHSYVGIPEGAEKVRIIASSDKKIALKINEIYILSEGDVPSWVQRWEPTHEKADILFVSTHPDDELIFFGGAIPTYAAEQQRKVVVAYFTSSNIARSSELLNGLWHMGVRNYPVIGDFKDAYAKSLSAAYKGAGGREKVMEWMTGLYRQFQPEVVVTQDKDGEYGHFQHKMVAEAAQLCVEYAAAEGQYMESFMEHGTWQVKKLYLHLWPENQITFDWDVPLVSMNGSTGLELAIEAYDLHKTQASSGMSVTKTGSEYDNRVFGLAYTAVGEDVRKDDFLENIYDSVGSFTEVEPTAAPTPAPTPMPAYVSVMPQLNEKGFIDEGEFIYSNEEEGLWIFVDETSKVIIQRKYDATQPLTWFECELWGDVEKGEVLKTTQNDPEKMGKVRVDATETAKKHGVVFAMNTDYYTYRVAVNNSRKTGVVIRDGRILYDDRYDADEISDSLFPNLDTLAFYPDGSLSVHHSYELTAQDYIDRGAYDVFSFGPYLIKDGKLSERAYDTSNTRNPRAAIGMVEPGHYVAIMCEGRLQRSSGVTMSYLAKLMRSKNCQVAFNIDGGQTAVVVFMGKQLNKIGAYDGGKTNSRPTSEVVGIGHSDQVGIYEVK